MHIFVYGTLKRNFKNYKYMDGSEFISKGYIKNYSLYQVNTRYPGIVECKGSKVFGEIFKINKEKLEELIELEGHEYELIEGYTHILEDEKMKTYIFKFKYSIDGLSKICDGNWNKNLDLG